MVKRRFLAVLLISIGGSARLASMGAAQSGTVDQLSEAELKQILAEAKETIKATNPATIIKEAKDALLNDRKQQAQVEAERFKDQNTLLYTSGPFKFGSLDYKFGIYKRDLIEGGVFAANMVADAWLYTKIKRMRIEHIFKAIQEHGDELERLLLYIQDKQAAAQTNSSGSSWFGSWTEKRRQQTLAAQLLEKHVAKRHQFLGYNWFTLQTAPLVAARIGVEKLGHAIEDKYIQKGWFPRIVEQGYEQDPNGELKKVRDLVISPVVLAKLLLNPRLAFTELFTGKKSERSLLHVINDYTTIGIPAWVLKPGVQKALGISIEVMTLGLAIKLFDTACQKQWTQYLIEHAQELLRLIERYKGLKATKDTLKPGALVGAEEDIKSYISRGHMTVSTVLPWQHLTQGVSYYNRADGAVASALGVVPVTGFLAWKAYKIHPWLAAPPAALCALSAYSAYRSLKN